MAQIHNYLLSCHIDVCHWRGCSQAFVLTPDTEGVYVWVTVCSLGGIFLFVLLVCWYIHCKRTGCAYAVSHHSVGQLQSTFWVGLYFKTYGSHSTQHFPSFIGALYGRIVGVAMVEAFGIYSTTEEDLYWVWIDPGAFALIGAASFFGGVSRLTVSLTVIMVWMCVHLSVYIQVTLKLNILKTVGIDHVMKAKNST